MTHERRKTGSQNPLTSLLNQAFDELMRQFMFCLPGKVKSFDETTQLAQVECGIQRMRRVQGQEAREPETIPIIEDVPVLMPGDGTWYHFHQVTENTEGLIHFSQRAIDTWIDQGGPVAPHESRILSEEDAFFVPGFRSRPNALSDMPNDGAGISNDDGSVRLHLKSDGSIAITSSGDVDVNGALITSGGDVVTAAGVSLDNHFHEQPADGGGDSESPTDAPTATE